MEDECKVLVQSFQEKCVTKIATREAEIFGSTELEKGIAPHDLTVAQFSDMFSHPAHNPPELAYLYAACNDYDIYG